MDSTIETDLILTRRQADGTVEWTPIEIPNRIDAAAGESYALIERAEFAAPQSLVAQRQGDALVIELGGTEALVVEGFFLAENVTFHPNPDIAGGAGPFSGPALAPDTTAIATSAEGATVLWSAGELAGELVGQAAEPEDDEAEGSEPGGGGGGSPALWGGLALGGLALAAAGGGGGGGGGSSGGGGGGGGGTTDTTAPQITSPTTAASIDENSGAGQVVYRATATDSSAVTFSLASGGDAAAFDIDADSGEVTLTEDPDFEGQASYSFTVIATDSAGNTARQTVSLSINNVDDAAPTITSGDTAAPIDEETGAGQPVYTATADDDGDISGGVTFSLASSDDAAAFDIDPDTGEVTLTENPDFETQSSYSFTVIATDAAGNSDQQAVTLEIVNRDESAPIFTSGFTADPINENSGADQVVYTATATDDEAIVFSLATSGDADAFEIDPDTGEVTLTENPNFEAQSSYSFAVIATDAEDNSRQLTVSLDVNNLDEVAPNITSGTTAAAIDENSGPGQNIYDANATDSGDISGGVTFSLGAGGDEAEFTINSGNGQVTLLADPDFEDQDEYSFTVIATDAAGNSGEQTVTLNINNLDEVAPNITSGATAAAIDENSGPGQVIYDANATDTGDISGGVTFSLGSGGDEAEFTINSGNGQVTLLADPDFEDQNEYSFTVIATDAAGNTDQQTVTLDINNLDEVAPNITSGATAAAIDENSGPGQVIYDANATDSGDTSGGVTFSLGSGGDEADFGIDPNNGEVTLTENPDFETQPSYTFTVIATDAAGNSDQQTVSLNINDIDDSAPSFTSGTTAAPIDENSGANQVIYDANATDAGTVTYTLANTGDFAAFDIDGITGEVTLTEDPDFEDQSSYTFTVVATDDDNNSSQRTVGLSINNLDEVAPNITSGATAAAIDENSGPGQVIYDANATDSGDISGGVTFSLGSDGDEAEFTINSSNGQVTLLADPDFEDQNEYSFTVIATDAAGNTDQQTVTLDINNLDEVAPNITSGATAAAIDENSGPGQVIYDANATDSGDISGGITFSLGSGGDEADFDIDPNNGEVTLTEDPDFETQQSYTFTVIATDAAGNSDQQTVSLDINDVDETAPSFTSGTTAAPIDENSGANQVVYDANATDAGTVTYTLANTGDFDAFDIDLNTGEVTLTEDPNFETQSSYTFTVVATDNEDNSSQRTVGLSINNLDEVAPNITSGAAAPGIAENSGADQVVYTATADDDGDISDGVTFSLASSGDAADFDIDPNTGEVALNENPDFESQSSYTFTVIATDAAGNTDQQAVTLDINNLDEVAPNITSGASASINENAGTNQLVYDANATDSGDISGGVTFSLGSGGDEAEFTINSSNGQVRLTESPDFETQSSYTFTVIATDAAGNTDQQTVTLDINNLDEVAPNITSGATATAIDENSGSGQVIYDANATDSGDISGGVTFSLGSGGDEAEFTINSGNGQVTLLADPDFEDQDEYSFTVIATDAAGNSDEQTVTLNINNLDEVAPNITSGATAPMIDENSGADQVIYTATATDDGDVSGGVTFSLGSGGDEADFDINSNNGEVTLTEDPDFETQSSYTFTVIATDAAGNSDQQTVSLDINDVNETAPMMLSAGEEDASFDPGTKAIAFDFGGSTTSQSATRSFDSESSIRISLSSDSPVPLLSSTTESLGQGDAWSTWSGADGLGSGDRITLVGAYDTGAPSTEIAAWREAVGSASLHASDDFLPAVESTGGAGFGLSTWDTNTGSLYLLDPINVNSLPSVFPTSQGLA